MATEKPSLDREKILRELQKQFLANVPQHMFDWKFSEDGWKLVNPAFQLQILYTTLWLPMIQKYPPNLAYRKSFLKTLIAKLEEKDVEVCDELYEVYTGYFAENHFPEQYSYKTYMLNSELVLTLRESLSIVSHASTGLVTWEAGKILAEWSLENKELFTDKTVLELGCGLGLTGTVIMKCCLPQKYIFTDCHPEVLRLLKHNLDLNFCITRENKKKPKRRSDSGVPTSSPPILQNEFSNQIITKNGPSTLPSEKELLNVNTTNSVSNKQINETNSDAFLNIKSSSIWEDKEILVAHLDWSSQKFDSANLQIDVIIAADVVYDSSIHDDLLKALLGLMQCGDDAKNRLAFIACTIRNSQTYLDFLAEAENIGFNVAKISVPKGVLFYYDKSSNFEILKLSLKN